MSTPVEVNKKQDSFFSKLKKPKTLQSIACALVVIVLVGGVIAGGATLFSLASETTVKSLGLLLYISLGLATFVLFCCATGRR